jgi:hypothetical protein
MRATRPFVDVQSVFVSTRRPRSKLKCDRSKVLN